MRGLPRAGFACLIDEFFLPVTQGRPPSQARFGPAGGGFVSRVPVPKGFLAITPDENRSRFVCWLFLFSLQALALRDNSMTIE
jgi:hypothetical protein